MAKAEQGEQYDGSFKTYEFTFVCTICGAHLSASAVGPDRHQAYGNALSVAINGHVKGWGGYPQCTSHDPYVVWNSSNYWEI